MESNFRMTLNLYPRDAGMDPDGLASASDVPSKHIREFLEGNRRNLTRPDISRLAFAFITFYDRVGSSVAPADKSPYTIADLENIFNDLRSSAGFPPLDERPENRIWHRLMSGDDKT